MNQPQVEPIRMQSLVSNEYDNDFCSICHVDIEQNMYTVPFCEHTFHSDCIIEWFRRGHTSCPYCRAEPEHNDQPRYIPWGDRQAIYTFKKNYATKVNAPKELKSLVRSLQKFEKKLKDDKKMVSEWKKSTDGQEYKRLVKIHRQHNGKTWRRNRKIRELKASIQNYPIVPAIVPTNIPT